MRYVLAHSSLGVFQGEYFGVVFWTGADKTARFEAETFASIEDAWEAAKKHLPIAGKFLNSDIERVIIYPIETNEDVINQKDNLGISVWETTEDEISIS